jgi:hypothetical protein
MGRGPGPSSYLSPDHHHDVDQTNHSLLHHVEHLEAPSQARQVVHMHVYRCMYMCVCVSACR